MRKVEQTEDEGLETKDQRSNTAAETWMAARRRKTHKESIEHQSVEPLTDHG